MLRNIHLATTIDLSVRCSLLFYFPIWLDVFAHKTKRISEKFLMENWLKWGKHSAYKTSAILSLCGTWVSLQAFKQEKHLSKLWSLCNTAKHGNNNLFIMQTAKHSQSWRRAHCVSVPCDHHFLKGVKNICSVNCWTFSCFLLCYVDAVFMHGVTNHYAFWEGLTVQLWCCVGPLPWLLTVSHDIT